MNDAVIGAVIDAVIDVVIDAVIARLAVTQITELTFDASAETEIYLECNS